MDTTKNSTTPLHDSIASPGAALLLCNGCKVREPWEHRCHSRDGGSCDCAACHPDAATTRIVALRERAASQSARIAELEGGAAGCVASC